MMANSESWRVASVFRTPSTRGSRGAVRVAPDRSGRRATHRSWPRCCQPARWRDLSDPRGVISPMPAPRSTLSPDALAQPGLRGTVRVLGGPGTGKTALLIRAAAAHVGAGVDPESVLLLTGSARLGTSTRAAITAAVLSDGRP